MVRGRPESPDSRTRPRHRLPLDGGRPVPVLLGLLLLVTLLVVRVVVRALLYDTVSLAAGCPPPPVPVELPTFPDGGLYFNTI